MTKERTETGGNVTRDRGTRAGEAATAERPTENEMRFEHVLRQLVIAREKARSGGAGGGG